MPRDGVPEQIPLHGKLVGNDAAALLKPVVHALALVREFDERAVDPERLAVDLDGRYLALIEIAQLPTAARQASARRMHRVAFALRIVIGHVQIDLAAVAVDIIGKQVIIEFELIEVNALEGPAMARPPGEMHRKFSKARASGNDLGGTRKQDRNEDEGQQHARSGEECRG